MPVDVGILLSPQQASKVAGCFFVLMIPVVLLVLVILAFIIGAEYWYISMPVIGVLIVAFADNRRRARAAAAEAEKEQQRIEALKAEKRMQRRSMSTTDKIAEAGSLAASGAQSLGKASIRAARASGAQSVRAGGKFKNSWKAVRSRRSDKAARDAEAVADARENGLLE